MERTVFRFPFAGPSKGPLLKWSERHIADTDDCRVRVDICRMPAAPVSPRWMAGLETRIETQVKAYCRLRLRFFRLHSR
jgi:hypothetical protein